MPHHGRSARASISLAPHALRPASLVGLQLPQSLEARPRQEPPYAPIQHYVFPAPWTQTGRPSRPPELGREPSTRLRALRSAEWLLPTMRKNPLSYSHEAIEHGA